VTTPGGGNAAAVPTGVNGAVIVSMPRQPEQSVTGQVHKKSSEWTPRGSGLRANPSSKRALDAVFARLEGSRVLANWDAFVALK
jgi:hypothetical protein